MSNKSHLEELIEGTPVRKLIEYKYYSLLSEKDIDYAHPIKNEPDYYYGAMGDWELFDFNKVSALPCMVDMALYTEDMDMMWSKFNASQITPAFFIQALDDLDTIEIEQACMAVVEHVWTGNHFWGKLLADSDLTGEEFITDYLFRLIHNIPEEKNPIDERGILSPPGSMSAVPLKKIKDLHENYLRRQSSESLDEYLLNFGDEYLEMVREFHEDVIEYDESFSKVLVDKKCAEHIEEVIRNTFISKPDYYSGSWSDTLEVLNGIGRSVVYGNFHELIDEEYVEIDKVKSLGEFVLYTLGEDLAREITDFDNDSVRP